MSDKISKLVSDIKNALEHAEDWERKKTSIKGIYLTKAPDSELRVMIFFNPPDEMGNPRKRKGWYFSDSDTVQTAKKAFNDERLPALVAAVEKINATGKRKGAIDEDIFEV